MLIENVVAVVVTLKPMDPPLLTLMSVANPWMVASPEPVTSHSDCGLPGSWFSAGMGLLACAVSLGTARRAPTNNSVPTIAARTGRTWRPRERKNPGMSLLEGKRRRSAPVDPFGVEE